MPTDRLARRLALPAALGALLLLAGCPGTLRDKSRFLADGGGTGGSGPCPDVPTEILAKRCGGSGCHGPMSPQQGLDLESPGVAARVVGRPAQECTGILADPQDPAGSILYRKLLPAPPCGDQMPSDTQTKLSEAELACVEAWIGAQVTQGTGGAGGAGGGGAGGAGGAPEGGQ